MARNKKLELDSDVPGQWFTADGRFAVVKRNKPINPMEATVDFKIKPEYSIHSFEEYDGPTQFPMLAPEVGRVDTFKEAFPWLGQYTGEGSFEKGEPDRVTPKPMGGPKAVSEVMGLLADVFREDLLVEDRIITKRWLSGVKKWWKQWVNKAPQVAKLLKEKDYKRVIDYVEDGEKRLARIKDNLDFEKGAMVNPQFVTGNEKKDRAAHRGLDPRVDLAYMFPKAKDALGDMRDRLRFSFNEIYNPQSSEYHLAQHTGDWAVEKRRYGKGGNLNGYESHVESMPEYANEVDKIVSGQIFRRLNRFVGEIEKMRAFDGEKGAELGTPIEREMSVGKMKVIFEPGYRDPSLLGKHPTVSLSAYSAREIIPVLKKAHALMRRAGFERAWYGNLYVMPEGTPRHEYTSRSGGKFKAGAHYNTAGDHMVMFGPTQQRESTIVHELGHRWYFKFMTRQQRLAFDSYFGGYEYYDDIPTQKPAPPGKVAAVSSYGGENPVEDFAEVFKWYVLGKKLSRDQRERFKEFATKSQRARRHEDVLDMRDELIG